ncbi:MAG: Rne/Rng family ribonuclease, partial [Deltaproteobacteria bacterium]
HLVFMPTYDKIAISRRISSEKERRRLRDIVSSLRPPGCGFIIRTVCEGMAREDIGADMDFLTRLWQSILKKKDKVSTPGILYEELDLTLRTMRDSFSQDVERLVIDDPAEFERAMRFVEECMPALAGRVELYEGKEDLFDAHGVEIELADAIEKKVWLRSGGHIVIDQMEALTAIDVNTGKYVGKKSSDETILKTNLEAVKEVVYQLRLRNIGGIIVIDFIDMGKAVDREKVFNALKDALKADKARTNILKISELGIVEMTRKRVRENLAQSLCEPCPYCDGNGLVKARYTILMDIYRELLKELPLNKNKTTLYVSPSVAELLQTVDADIIKDLEKRFDKKMTIRAVDRFHQERYEIG